MARRVVRGEIWSYRFKSPDKRRPVLVLTRPEVIPLLHTVMVAPVTSTRRGAPARSTSASRRAEARLGGQSRSRPDRRAGTVGRLRWDVSPAKMQQVCRALGVATGASDATDDAAVRRDRDRAWRHGQRRGRPCRVSRPARARHRAVSARARERIEPWPLARDQAGLLRGSRLLPLLRRAYELWRRLRPTPGGGSCRLPAG